MPAVGDAIDRAVLLVGDQQRAVRHLQHVDRPAPERVGLGVEEAGHERRDGRLAAVDLGLHDVIAELLVRFQEPRRAMKAVFL